MVLAWPRAGALWSGWAVASGPKPSPVWAQPFISRCPNCRPQHPLYRGAPGGYRGAARNGNHFGQSNVRQNGLMDGIRTIRLLVVEDSPSYLYLIQSAFHGRQGKFRWALTVAEDGQRALHLLFEEEAESAPLPDLILLDWNLPKVSGNEVLRRIKEHSKLRRIPVLVFSSSEADEDVHDAYDYHANGYIMKPDGVDALAEIVETIERFWVAVARLPKVMR